MGTNIFWLFSFRCHQHEPCHVAWEDNLKHKKTPKLSFGKQAVSGQNFPKFLDTPGVLLEKYS